MPRVHFVKKARKDNPVCKRGESYYWWKFNFGPKRFSLTHPKPSQLTQSSFLSQIYSLQECLTDEFSDFDNLESAKENLVSELESLRDECQDNLDNMPDHLQDQSDAGNTLTERIEMLDDSIDAISGLEVEQEPDDWNDEFEDWDKMKEEEQEEHIEEWKQEKINEFIEEINDNWPDV